MLRVESWCFRVRSPRVSVHRTVLVIALKGTYAKVK